MANKFHRLLVPADGIHVIQAWDVATTGARDALVVTAADIGKVARVTANGLFYVLESVSPSVWRQVLNEVSIVTKSNTTLAINTQSGTTYTTVLADGTDTLVKFTNAGNIAVTIPTNASVAYAIGSILTFLQHGTGQITVSGAGGVTIDIAGALFAKTRTQFSQISLVKIGTDEWVISGDLSLT